MSRRAIGFLCVWGIACLASASASESPQQIVEILYKPYLLDPNAQSPIQFPDSLESIGRWASDGLGKAIQKERACQQREGLCHIDFDIIICAQDWDISNFHMAKSRENASSSAVNATFSNGGKAAEVRYLFVRENGAWKIDDIEEKCSADDRQPFRLKQSLAKG